ncbi:hypothetical protein CR513_23097, partial [Mucuna pruriens]
MQEVKSYEGSSPPRDDPSTSQLDQDIQAFKTVFLLLDLAMSNFSPLYPYTMFFIHRLIQDWNCVLLKRTIGDRVPIVGVDNAQLQSSLSIHNVLHVPKLANNLIFIHRLIRLKVCNLTMGRMIGVAKEQGGLYYLQHTKIGNNTNKEDLPSSQRATLETWEASQIWLHHKRLGHPQFKSIESFNCDVCQFSNYYRATFSPSNNKNLVSFDLIHFDVWGLASNSIWGLASNSIQGLSGLSNIYRFFHLVKNQFGKSIKRLRLDNGIKFVYLEFSKFFKDNGVVNELTCMNISQQNGVAERKNCSSP